MIMASPAKSLLKLILLSSVILIIHGGAISSVTVSKSKPVQQSPKKSIGKINIPQVPEFPKLPSRPGKNTGSSSFSNKPHDSSQQQHSQPVQAIPQTSVQNLLPPFSLPIVSPSASLQVPAPSYAYAAKPVAAVNYQVTQEIEEEDVQEEDHREDQEYSDSEYSNVDEEDVTYNQESHSVEVETTYQQYDSTPVVSTVTSKNDSTSGNKHSEVAQTLPALAPEKIQETTQEFSMPQHVLNILNAMGNGGSLAQASKPEKEVGGQGYTTANAVGYATGDNATVTASVSNKMEFNTQTVILTESASASASSMSNGTAFSQATLASNGYQSQFGPGGGWKSQTKNPVPGMFK